jgi:hypothetical protein
MAWTLEFDAQRGVICLAFAGTVSAEEVRDSSKAVIAEIAARRTRRILTDFTGVTLLAVSTTEVYKLPDAYRTLGLAGPFREAVVTSADPAVRDTVRFYETVCLNRGSTVRTFDDRAQALDWLAGADRAKPPPALPA